MSFSRQEDVPPRIPLFDQSQPTSPDPVEMVRQFEEDEKLARVLQEYQTMDYVEQEGYLEESARVARQLQDEFDREMLGVLSPQTFECQPQNSTTDLSTNVESENCDSESSLDETREEEFTDIESSFVEPEYAGPEDENEDEVDDFSDEEDEFADAGEEFGDVEDEFHVVGVEFEVEGDEFEDAEGDSDDSESDGEQEDDDEESDEEVDDDDEEEDPFEDGEDISDEEIDVLNPSRLHAEEIERLPTRIFSALPSSCNSSGPKVCQICQENYANGDELRILPCFHDFHTQCIDPWLRSSTTCPVCRVTVDLTERVSC